jgi:hypothetical protein
MKHPAFIRLHIVNKFDFSISITEGIIPNTEAIYYSQKKNIYTTIL